MQKISTIKKWGYEQKLYEITIMSINFVKFVVRNASLKWKLKAYIFTFSSKQIC